MADNPQNPNSASPPTSGGDDKPLTVPTPAATDIGKSLDEKLGRTPAVPAPTETPYSAKPPAPEELKAAEEKAKAVVAGKDPGAVKSGTAKEGTKPPEIKTDPGVDKVKLGGGGGFFKKHGKKVLALGALVLFVLAIPAAVFLTEQSQELRRSADEGDDVYTIVGGGDLFACPTSLPNCNEIAQGSTDFVCDVASGTCFNSVYYCPQNPGGENACSENPMVITDIPIGADMDWIIAWIQENNPDIYAQMTANGGVLQLDLFSGDFYPFFLFFGF